MGLKVFFRYIRGELLNGFYIRKLNLVPNGLTSIDEFKKEMLYWMSFQFTTTDELYPIREKDLKDIAQVAGILSIRGATGSLPGWVRLSESTIVDGVERSERGLLNQETGTLDYVRTALESYDSDISAIATDGLRMSLIPEGAEPEGYVWGDEAAAILDSGKINPDELRSTPPEGYEYNETTGEWEWTIEDEDAPVFAAWYGDQYLPLADSYPLIIELPNLLFESLVETHQKIKYDGLGLKNILDITESLIPDLISDLNLELLKTEDDVYYHKMTFTRDEEAFSDDDGWGRFSAWKYFIESKYPFIIFNEAGV